MYVCPPPFPLQMSHGEERFFNETLFYVQNPQLSGVGVGVIDKRSRAAPWSEVTAGGGGGSGVSSDKVHHPATVAGGAAVAAGYEEAEHEGGMASSERAHLPHLGPIGPPSK